LGLALLIGVFAGGLIAAAAGARRINSAYDRFSVATRAADIGVRPGCLEPTDDGGCASVADPAALSALDAVDEMVVGYSWPAPVTTVDGRLLNPRGDSCFSGSGELIVFGSPDQHLAWRTNGFLLDAGRRADPDRTDEVALSLAASQRTGIRVGDELLLHLHAADCLDRAAWGEATRVRVVGIGQMASEVPGQTFYLEGVHITPALSVDLLQSTRPGTATPLVFVGLSEGVSTDDFVAAADAAGLPVTVDLEADRLRDGVQRRLTPDATVLWLVAIIGGAAAIIVLGSAVAHVGAISADDGPALRTLGWRDKEFAAWASAVGALVGLAAGFISVVVAISVSGVVMIGDARHIDPHQGMRIDALPMAVGCGITVIVVTAAFAIGRLSATRTTTSKRRSATRAGWSEVLLARLPRFPVTALAGIRFAVAPSTRAAVPFWRSAVGLTVGIVGVVAALTFLAGVDHLVTTPRLLGVTWDVAAGLPESSVDQGDIDEVLRQLRDDPRVRAVSEGTYFPPLYAPTPITVGKAGIAIYPMSFSTGPNDVEPTVIEGRAPENADEILLNPLLANRLELSIGEQLTVEMTNYDGTVGTYPFELVGTGVLPVGDGRVEIGSSMTLDGLRRLAPGAPAQLLFVDLAEPSSAQAVLDRVGMDLTTDYLGGPVGAAELLGINVTRTRQAPMVLIVVLGLMSIAVLAYLSTTAVRARSTEIAVTRALGFDSRQVRRAAAWMVTIIGGVALAIGLPLGVVAGRMAFNVYARRLGAPPEPAIAPWGLAGLVPVLLVTAYLVSLWPGWRASKVTAASVLHAE
jgi:ABC-type lipoprotein release transport system permease subunit